MPQLITPYLPLVASDKRQLARLLAGWAAVPRLRSSWSTWPSWLALMPGLLEGLLAGFRDLDRLEIYECPDPLTSYTVLTVDANHAAWWRLQRRYGLAKPTPKKPFPFSCCFRKLAARKGTAGTVDTRRHLHEIARCKPTRKFHIDSKASRQPRLQFLTNFFCTAGGPPSIAHCN
jgi:hypothetical protein